MTQEELLEKIAEILEKLHIPYIITGGIAVTVWGRPRFTADIDIVVELEFLKINALAKALLAVSEDAYVDKDIMVEALKNKGEFNFIHPSTGLKVDFWILKNEAFDRARLERRISKKVNNQNIYFSSPEDLILSKLFWYKESLSTRQIEDVESVLSIQKKLDWDYILKWAGAQGTLDVLNKILGKGNK